MTCGRRPARRPPSCRRRHDVRRRSRAEQSAMGTDCTTSPTAADPRLSFDQTAESMARLPVRSIASTSVRVVAAGSCSPCCQSRGRLARGQRTRNASTASAAVRFDRGTRSRLPKGRVRTSRGIGSSAGSVAMRFNAMLDGEVGITVVLAQAQALADGVHRRVYHAAADVCCHEPREPIEDACNPLLAGA